MNNFVFNGFLEPVEPVDRFQVDRIKRALHQRIYVINSDRVGQESRHRIMGASNREYNVVIRHNDILGTDHTCSCIDFRNRSKACKHIYSALFRIHRIRPETFIAESDTDELLEENFHERRHYNPDPPERRAPRKKKVQQSDMLTEEPDDAVEGITCPICYEDYEKDGELRVWCVACKQVLHEDCKRMWFKNHRTCPLCRHKY
jgi:hypothetical protein